MKTSDIVLKVRQDKDGNPSPDDYVEAGKAEGIREVVEGIVEAKRLEAYNLDVLQRYAESKGKRLAFVPKELPFCENYRFQATAAFEWKCDFEMMKRFCPLNKEIQFMEVPENE